jgi:hypothetical protein
LACATTFYGSILEQERLIETSKDESFQCSVPMSHPVTAAFAPDLDIILLPFAHHSNRTRLHSSTSL